MAVNDWENFTVENNVYKGKTSPYTGNYKSLGEMIWTKIKSHGDKIAHLDACTDKVVTYAELQDKVVKCALWLQKQGIKSGDVITVCTHNQINSIVPCLAASYINVIFNTWKDNMDWQATLHLLQLFSPKVIFCSEECVNIILRAMKEKNYSALVVVFGNHPDVFSFSDILNNYSETEVANFQYVKLDDINSTVCILPSSGTTGLSKNVELSHYALLYVSEEQKIYVHPSTLWVSTLFWFSGVLLNLQMIVRGMKVIIYPKFDEEMICKLIEKYKVTMMILSTSMLIRFIKSDYVKKYPLSSLKVIIGSGATLKSKVQENLKSILSHVDILQSFGLLEIGGIATMQFLQHKIGSCGTVVANVEIKVVDPNSGKILGPNQQGELWIKSLIMMNGYYKNPEATKNTIDKDGWLHSGDVGYIDEDGELFIVDRIKELIKYRTLQISPGEIEDVLMSHPTVLEAAVVAVPHPIDGEHPVAYVTKKPGAKETEKDLIDFVASKMADQYKLRAGVIFVDILPYTGSGKIAREDLKTMAKKLAAE